MAHLDTAYKLGALRAQTDFEAEISKMAAPAGPAPAGPAPAGPALAGSAPAAATLRPHRPALLPAQQGASDVAHMTGAPVAAVRPGATAGRASITGGTIKRTPPANPQLDAYLQGVKTTP